MSRKKKDKSAQSTRQLMGIDSVKDYCIATRMGDLVFFIIKPTNISVLPDSSICLLYTSGPLHPPRSRPWSITWCSPPST